MRVRALSVITLPLCAVFAFVQPVPGQTAGVLDRFVGVWKEDESKRDLSANAPLVFRQGTNIEELRDGEVSLIVEQIVFDETPQPLDDGTTSSWQRLGADTYQRKLTRNGQLVTTRTLTISPGGGTLTEKTDQATAAPSLSIAWDRKPQTTTVVYERLEGTAGLVGRWKAMSFTSTVPAMRSITRTGPNAISYRDGFGRGFTATLDGKAAPEVGPAVMAGSMGKVRVTGVGSLEITYSRAGKEIGRTWLELSSDEKFLTEIARASGSNRAASVSVYTRR